MESVAKRIALSPSSARVVTKSQVEATSFGTMGVGHVDPKLEPGDFVCVACSTICSMPAPSASEAATAAAPPANKARRDTRGFVCGLLKIKGKCDVLGGCCSSCSSLACNSAANSGRGVTSSGKAERKNEAIR